jgi:hypothetical protein
MKQYVTPRDTNDDDVQQYQAWKRKKDSRYDERFENWDWLIEQGQKMIDEGMDPKEMQAITQGLAQLATVITGIMLEKRGRARNKKFYAEDSADD